MSKTFRFVIVAAAAAAVLAVVVAFPIVSAADKAPEPCVPPAGWLLAGSAPAAYSACKVKREDGTGAALQLSSDSAGQEVFGTVMQTVAPAEYAGKRVRLSAQLRTADVTAWSGLWMRVDRQGGAPGAFDNMQDRPLTGTAVWSRREVVLDVASDAVALAFGVLQSGGGSTWADDMKLEVVGKDVPTTDARPQVALPAGPVNLDFEQ